MNRMILGALMLVVASGCSKPWRGAPSAEPPVQPVQNMFTQDKGKPQRENDFFPDKRTMRPLIAGTISRDAADDATDPYLTGKLAVAPSNLLSGSVEAPPQPSVNSASETTLFVQQVPVPITEELLHRGQERYDIYCSACHGVSGYGNGAAVAQAKKGGLLWSVTSYHEERLRNRQENPDGRIFDVITNGIRTMPSYASQIPVSDRWAIVAYIRALQRSQHATMEDVPLEERSRLK